MHCKYSCKKPGPMNYTHLVKEQKCYYVTYMSKDKLNCAAGRRTLEYQPLSTKEELLVNSQQTKKQSVNNCK